LNEFWDGINRPRVKKFKGRTTGGYPDLEQYPESGRVSKTEPGTTVKRKAARKAKGGAQAAKDASTNDKATKKAAARTQEAIFARQLISATWLS
jgi:hypothetical protein